MSLLPLCFCSFPWSVLWARQSTTAGPSRPGPRCRGRSTRRFDAVEGRLRPHAGADQHEEIYNRPDVIGIQIVPTYTSAGGAQIVVTGTGIVPTSFMRVVGISTMAIDVSSTVRWGNTRLRVALVLDTTGSMSSANKMTALKAATENLLKQLQSAAANVGDVYLFVARCAPSTGKRNLMVRAGVPSSCSNIQPRRRTYNSPNQRGRRSKALCPTAILSSHRPLIRSKTGRCRTRCRPTATGRVPDR